MLALGAGSLWALAASGAWRMGGVYVERAGGVRRPTPPWMAAHGGRRRVAEVSQRGQAGLLGLVMAT
ncbi:hypothetical protein GQ55_3G233700 [Panicum hallii var. hallii]|jgi:hypothetical protein|uniref:Uncharacterized protein n=1 Tax=Panicum hallii var. hallii TaxID=1504633 RepID=A0A2T7ECK9_9POAL|nr:hypothetical protein GQ55_3G233600 [Panicum hallii var. hallii]PUZ65560.1 hypothetical protein GQ55_3G233700 [Panicum hallii var. hallii]